MAVYRLMCIFMVFGIAAATHKTQPGLMKSVYSILNNISSIALMPELMETEACRRDCELYRQYFLKNEMWAVEMYDANGRLSAGVLKGNLNLIGNLRECINVRYDSVIGKFCQANIDIQPKGNDKLVENIWDKFMVQNMSKLETHVNTDSVIMNGFISGLCIPSSCSSLELTNALNKIVSPLNQSEFDLVVHVQGIRDWNCSIKKEQKTLNYMKILLIGMFTFTCFATLADALFLKENEVPKSFGVALIESFSLKFNWKSVVHVNESTEKIKWMNGLLCILQFVMYQVHYQSRLFMSVIADRSDWYNFFLDNQFIMLTPARNVFLLIDLTLIFHGICHSYKLTKLLSKKKYGSMFYLCLGKYVKFLLFMMTIILLTYISHNECGLKINALGKSFRLWKIILCLENAYGIAEMSFPPAYLLCINTQLYIFGAVTLILCGRQKNAMRSFLIIIILMLIYRVIIVYVNEIIPTIMLPISITEMVEMFESLHNSSLARSVYYLSGVAFGYYISTNNTKFPHLNPIIKRLGWIVALFCFYHVYTCIIFMDAGYKYNRMDAVVVVLKQTVGWILFWIWVVWYCHTFDRSAMSRFLSAKIFIVLNRISGIFSIIHITVLMNFVFSGQSGSMDYQLTDLGLNYYFFSILCCYVIVFVIQLPAMNIVKYLK